MEIEIKAHLTDRETAMEKLRALGCTFSAVVTQDDMVWVKNVGDLDTFLSNTVFMRIRIEDGGKVLLTAKKSKQKTGDRSLVKREHEVVIDSVDEARGILEMLGLQEAVRTVKKRLTTHYKDFEICIDEVDGLGSFIELEKIIDTDEADEVQRDMRRFLQTLGVSEADKVSKGYDILMLEKK